LLCYSVFSKLLQGKYKGGINMAKSILILTGSPRKGGNSDLLADTFIAGAQQTGHTTVKYATAEKDKDLV
jgi:hypothetical protein